MYGIELNPKLIDSEEKALGALKAYGKIDPGAISHRCVQKLVAKGLAVRGEKGVIYPTEAAKR